MFDSASDSTDASATFPETPALRSLATLRDPSDQLDDQSFLERFEACGIPAACWDHAQQLRITFLYLRELSFDDGVRRLRAGIRAIHRIDRVSTHCGIHETRLIAWARLVAAAIARDPGAATFADFERAHPELRVEAALFRHYAPEQLGSARARTSFVAPGRAALPTTPRR